MRIVSSPKTLRSNGMPNRHLASKPTSVAISNVNSKFQIVSAEAMDKKTEEDLPFLDCLSECEFTEDEEDEKKGGEGKNDMANFSGLKSPKTTAQNSVIEGEGGAGKTRALRGEGDSRRIPSTEASMKEPETNDVSNCAPLRRAHKYLEKFHLPFGLMPMAELESFELDEASGKFVASQDKEMRCEFNGSHIQFGKRVEGIMGERFIKDVKGIKGKMFMFWVPITNVQVDSPPKELIHFQVGPMKASFPARELWEYEYWPQAFYESDKRKNNDTNDSKAVSSAEKSDKNRDNHNPHSDKEEVTRVEKSDNVDARKQSHLEDTMQEAEAESFQSQPLKISAQKPARGELTEPRTVSEGRRHLNLTNSKSEAEIILFSSSAPSSPPSPSISSSLCSSPSSSTCSSDEVGRRRRISLSSSLSPSSSPCPSNASCSFSSISSSLSSSPARSPARYPSPSFASSSRQVFFEEV